MHSAAEFATPCRKGALSGPGYREFMLRGCGSDETRIFKRPFAERRATIVSLGDQGGSYPPGFQGWQFDIRRRPRARPFTGPYFLSDSTM